MRLSTGILVSFVTLSLSAAVAMAALVARLLMGRGGDDIPTARLKPASQPVTFSDGASPGKAPGLPLNADLGDARMSPDSIL